MPSVTHSILTFVARQASCAVFGIFLLTLMLGTSFYYPFSPFLHRYDFIFIAAVVFQLTLVFLKLENKHEIFSIAIFHILATIMELFKTSDSIQAWHYPEKYVFGINNVPLFTGFMYSAVGSYIARSWKVFQLRYDNYPRIEWTILLVVAIFLNFFTHHFVIDVRWLLVIASVALFFRTRLHLSVQSRSGLPILAVWIAIAVLIWLAENIATYANVWLYPNQVRGWQMVSFEKVTSWYLLMLLSFVLISLIKLTDKFTVIENYTKFITTTYLALIPVIIIDANLGYASETFAFLKLIPGTYHTGHVFLYGGLAVIANIVFRFKTINVRGQNILLSSVVVFSFVVIEEISQLWIPTRVFDPMDIVSSFVGIVALSYIAFQIHKRTSRGQI